VIESCETGRGAIVTLDLEPQVLESIDRSRRKRYIERALVVIPIALALAAIVALMVFSYKGDGLVIAFAALIIAIGVVAGLVIAVQRNYRKFTLQADFGSQPSRALFADKLDSVSIGVGIPTPELVVLQLPSVNAVAFQKSGKPAVGVTESAVKGRFSASKAEAMMAHEVAHILIGDMLRPMNAWSLRTIAFASLLSLTLIAIPTVILSCMEEPGFPPAVGVASFIFLIWAGFAFDYIFRRFDYETRHDDILADSIAARLTEDPAALREAIMDSDESVEEDGGGLPWNHCSRHMFVCPHDAERVARTSFGLRDRLSYHFASIEDDRSQATRSARTLAGRLENLEAIENGHWPRFEQD